MSCDRCKLRATNAKGKVPVYFSANARIDNIDTLFIDEGPSGVDQIIGKRIDKSYMGLLSFIANKSGCTMYALVGILGCYCTSTFNGKRRTPTKDELFYCLPSLLQTIKELHPKKIVFIGDTVFKHMKSFIKGSIVIPAFAAMRATGGLNSHLVVVSIRRLKGEVHEELFNFN